MTDTPNDPTRRQARKQQLAAYCATGLMVCFLAAALILGAIGNLAGCMLALIAFAISAGWMYYAFGRLESS